MALSVYPIYPSDLTDAEWALQAPLIPAAKPGGRPRSVNLRRIVNGLFYLLRTGCAWRYLPQEYGPWQTYTHANWAKPNELSIFGSGHTHPDIVPSIEVN